MKYLFFPSFKVLLIVLGLFFLILILTIITIFTPSDSQIPSQSAPIPIISPRPSTQPLPLQSPQTPDIVYSPNQLEQDYERIVNKQPLSVSDSQIRSELINSLDNKSGYLERTPEYNIEYVKAPDLFMIEILSLQTEDAKRQALAWFTQQGLSNQGICNLPVSIYLNSSTKNTLSAQNQTFNPIPEICQQ